MAEDRVGEFYKELETAISPHYLLMKIKGNSVCIVCHDVRDLKMGDVLRKWGIGERCSSPTIEKLRQYGISPDEFEEDMEHIERYCDFIELTLI